MRTFVEVFPQATLWQDGEFLIGSLEPLRLVPGRVASARRLPVTARALDAIGLPDDSTLVRWFTGGPNEIRRFVGAGLLLTDDRPLLEYHRSLPSSRPVENIDALRGDVAQVMPSIAFPTQVRARRSSVPLGPTTVRRISRKRGDGFKSQDDGCAHGRRIG